MNKIKKYIGAAVVGATVLATPACSDAWDEHYGTGGENTAATTATLWDLIAENPNLSNFKDIAEASTYYRDQEHPQNGYTFKDLLQGSMLTTVWIPTNDAFTSTDVAKWLSYARGEKGYTVQQQLLANCMALWRQTAIGGGTPIDTVTMLNGKKMSFDKINLTMQGIAIDPQNKNITASNGTMHFVNTALPFKYNLYEFLKDNDNATANSMTRFHDYLIINDTTYFSEEMSIEGTPDINGNPTYVDSVYVTTNKLFFGNHRFPTESNTNQYLTYEESFGASIDKEDSTFILLMPTDAAWDNAVQDLKPLYKYAEAYADNQKIDAGTNNAEPRLINDVDSFQQKNLTMDMASPLCFNLHFQPDAAGNRGRWHLEDFLASKGASAKYFLNTFGDTLRSDANWEKTTLLDGEQISVSNGIGIKKDEWSIPMKLYKPDLYIEAGYRSMYKPENSQNGTMKSYSYTYDVVKPWLSQTGRLFNDDFVCLSPDQATSAPRFDFKLVGTHGENYESEVMSGKYDIYVVMVPNFYMTSSTSDKVVYTLGDDGSAKVVGTDTIPVKHKLRATITYCNGNAQGREGSIKSDIVDYTGEKVDTLLLFKDFEFPYSYKNLRFSYPSIQITTDHKSADLRDAYSNYICIDRFILRSKED